MNEPTDQEIMELQIAEVASTRPYKKKVKDRRPWTTEQKINFIVEYLQGTSLKEIVKREELSPSVLNRWKERYLSTARKRLGMLDAEASSPKEIQIVSHKKKAAEVVAPPPISTAPNENALLREVIAELAIENYLRKKLNS